MIGGFIVRFLATVVAVAVASFVIPGIRLTSPRPSTDVFALVAVAAIFGLVNSLVKPLFRYRHTPVYLVVLGLSLLVVNAALLLLTSWVCEVAGIAWHVDSPLPALGAALLVSVVSFLVNSLFGRRGEVHR